MEEKATDLISEIAGVASVEPDRIELMVEEAVERVGPRFSVHRADVKLDPEKKSLQSLTRGRANVCGFYNDDFTELRGTFQLSGYRSSHTPLGLDHLELTFQLGEVA